MVFTFDKTSISGRDGGAIGGAVGIMTTKEISKAGERHKQRVFEKRNSRKFASKQSKVITCNVCCVCLNESVLNIYKIRTRIFFNGTKCYLIVMKGIIIKYKL